MRLRSFVASIALLLLPSFVRGQLLEIHYIDVGWGSSVLVRGPDGTTVLLEAGETGKGTQDVVPYLKKIGIRPDDGLDYVIGGHQHCDHIGGLDEVIQAGYDVRERQYANASSYSSTCVDVWNAAAATTTAGAPVPMPVGTVLPLGSGARITCIARNGSIIGGGSVAVSDENDRSIALLLQYGGFDYLWAGDLGGGSDACTGRSTSQKNVETAVIRAISPGGTAPLISAGGIDVLHVNHHGSESSTNPEYFTLARPDLAVIAVGDGQTSGWDLPQIDVVENVLLGQASACVTAPPTFVLQTEEGFPKGSRTSTAGYCVGNITITTDGRSIFTVSADGDVHQGPVELSASGLPRSFTIDEIRPSRRRPARRGFLSSADPRSITAPMAPAERLRPVRAQTLVDCPSIQNAIDALPATGGVLTLPSGIYPCATPIVIAKDDVELRGHGPATVLRLAAGANAPVLILGDASPIPAAVHRRIRVADLTIDGNMEEQTEECFQGPCTPENPLRNNGITLRRVEDVRVENVTIRAARSGGLVTELGCRRLVIRGLTSSENFFDGVAGYETEESVFSELILHRNRAAGLSLDIAFNKNVISDAVISESGKVGIFMRDVRDNVFSGLQIRSCGEHGVFLAQVDTDTTKPAAGNSFLGIVVADSKGEGFRANDASCTNNVIVGSQLVANRDGCIGEAVPGLVQSVGTICR
ncbi:MAG: right-handed parallel beta-helix repeat-containing protein [Thermoanaerobaculia bacterium]